MDVYLLLKWAHIVTAGVVVGMLVTYPFLPTGIPQDSNERAVTRHMLRFLHRSSNALLIPSLVILFVTGLFMSVGPFSEWEVFGREGQWIVVGMFLWTLVAAIVGGVLLGLVKEMLSLAERDELNSPRLAKLWKQFRWGYFTGAAVSLATIWVMVFQPVFF